MLKRVIVTGGTGVTGNALVRYLLNQGIQVTAFIRRNSCRKDSLPAHKNLTVLPCNMEEYDSIGKDLGKNYDAFFHLAWDGSMGKEKVDNRNQMFLQERNIFYMLKAVELCHEINCSVFVATGSQAEYGRYTGVISEQTPTVPENGYGMAKLCAGQMTRVLCRKYGIRHIWARLFSIYGPHDGAQSLIDTSILKLKKGEPTAYTKGEQIWDYLYSYDAAKALMLLAEKGKDGEIYCVASGDSRPLKEYIIQMHEVVAPDIIPIFGQIPYGENQVMQMTPDITKLVADTGFFPEYTFKEGISEILMQEVHLIG